MTKKAMILLYFLTVGRGQTLNQLKSSQDPDPINFSLEHNFYHIGQSDKFNHTGQSGKFNHIGQSDKFNHTGQSGKFNHTGQSDKFNHIGQSPIRYHRLNFLFKLGGSSGM